MRDSDKRCQQYYQDQFAKYLQCYTPGEALNECLHDFLDQRPSGKYSSRNRAAGLASAQFWWASETVAEADLASQALARVLHFDDAIDIGLLSHLATHNADQLRWAVRYSKLFTRRDSPLWVHLRKSCAGLQWQTFIDVCDRLIMRLEPFDQAILDAERRLKSLSLLELLSYLSVLAYFRLADARGDPAGMEWVAYERIIQRKLRTCTESDFRLSTDVLGRSLKRHLSPMLFPQRGEGAECAANLDAVSEMVVAVRELIECERSIDQFCFDSQCDYQLSSGSPVIVNRSNEGVLRWQRTEQKSQLLWCYWMRRAIETFAASELAGKLIGRADNHEANQLAYIKTIRSQLYLQVVFGLGERVRLNNGAEVTLFHAMLASELTRAFFEQAYLQPYQRYLDESGEPITALGRLAFEGLLQGENRFPMTWSEQPEKIQRIRAWTVSDDHPDGDPEAAKAILQFWTSDLQTLSEQVRQPPNLPTPRLSEKPFYKIGRYSFQFPWVAGRQNSLSAAVNNLRRVEQRRSELRSETERIEHNLAHSLRQRGFHVVVGYEPRRVDAQDAGEIDLLACLAGVILLLEVKSGFIRSTQQEVWLHRTNTLRKAARQLRRKSVAVRQALQHDLGLRAALGLAAPDPLPTLHGWVVDTSIEFDGEVVDGFRIVSREVIEVALRDELHYLKALDKQGANEVATLYPEGFSATAFARIIEQSEVWKEL
ncbi:nuclease-related domain-containing protein [Stutzerimonas stutzeri]|uniref:nuclease-related domain-containing protein n=1 Tax=Stutzerimonas stutzeri TaxID=316 RepID=UPI000F7684AD|nr:nuclease-related domain-containing protein [Stutzerimonas stutzeri]MCP3432550.1 NERD domain-containing protein [Stutzerimonas stutzeri]RRV61393.1 NERD domain-containing protein [Stutzerimonas stutzeri]RTM24810.1 NERD domain-containing protein [Stutzerimonas stutzeri]